MALMKNLGALGKEICPEWIFFRRGMRKHKSCQIRKPYISWKVHPIVLLAKGFEKEIEKVLFERDVLLLGGKLHWLVWIFMLSGMELFSKFLTMGNTMNFIFYFSSYSLFLLSLLPLDPRTDNHLVCVPPIQHTDLAHPSWGEPGEPPSMSHESQREKKHQQFSPVIFFCWIPVNDLLGGSVCLSVFVCLFCLVSFWFCLIFFCSYFFFFLSFAIICFYENICLLLLWKTDLWINLD